MDREQKDSTPAENVEEKKGSEEVLQPPSPNALKVAAAECLNSWIQYLQMLNSMCSAGFRLSQSLTNLAQMQNIQLAIQSQNSWEELTKSTLFATNAVKTHIAATMQDMSIGDTFTDADAQRQQEHNQLIIAENLLTFINLQYQFSLASCEYFGAMAMCPSCQTTPGGAHEVDCSMATVQQCFGRLYVSESRSQMSSPHRAVEHSSLDSPKLYETNIPRQHSPLTTESRTPPFQESVKVSSPGQSFGESTRGIYLSEGIKSSLPNQGPLHSLKSTYTGRGSRSPLHFPLFPLSGQRRWSEAAAAEVSGENSDSTMRRWSMPWDSGRAEAAPWQQRYLPSKLIVPPSGPSQERSRSTTPEAIPQASTLGGGEGIAEAIQLLSCRPMRSSIPQTALPGHPLPGTAFGGPPWGETHEERMHRRMYPGPSSQRGNWQSIDVPHASGMSVTEHYDIFPSGLPLTSRKSSSSTDSSCLSVHSRSTTSSSEKGSESIASSGEAVRLHSNFYSMWSGSEHLSFIRLPESQEPQDSDTDDPPTEKSGIAHFPKPS